MIISQYCKHFFTISIAIFRPPSDAQAEKENSLFISELLRNLKPQVLFFNFPGQNAKICDVSRFAPG